MEGGEGVVPWDDGMHSSYLIPKIRYVLLPGRSLRLPFCYPIHGNLLLSPFHPTLASLTFDLKKSNNFVLPESVSLSGSSFGPAIYLFILLGPNL